MTAIKVENVGVRYERTKVRDKNIKPFELAWWLNSKESFWALDSLSFDVKEGQVLGVIGSNGAGKSTLLRLLTGVLKPDVGKVQVNGKVSALLGLGTGFQADLSGRDNIYLSGMYMNMSEQEIDDQFNNIVKFAGLEEFIETPIRYYSSGMKARLGFSLAVHVDPEILIVDEVLATGDRAFQKKAKNRMTVIMRTAKAIVLVSHNTSFIKEFCDEAIWLVHGKVKMKGSAKDVVEIYEREN